MATPRKKLVDAIETQFHLSDFVSSRSTTVTPQFRQQHDAITVQHDTVTVQHDTVQVHCATVLRFKRTQTDTPP